MNVDHDQDNPHDEKLSDMMRRAEDGDLLAAREVVQHLAWLVSTSNTYRDLRSDNQNKRAAVPVPTFAREYLSRALERIASGMDANKAFFISKRGRPQQWSYRDKQLAVSIMAQLIAQGQVVSEAAQDAAELINKNAHNEASENRVRVWNAFAKWPIDGTTLQTWFYQLKKRSLPST